MSAKQLISIIVILVVLVLAGWLAVFFMPQSVAPENNQVVGQRAVSLEKKLQSLLTGAQNIRLQEFQKTLKSFVSLPLPTRAGGKDNPFLEVTAPVDQFSRPGGVPTTLPTNQPISNRR